MPFQVFHKEGRYAQILDKKALTMTVENLPDECQTSLFLPRQRILIANRPIEHHQCQAMKAGRPSLMNFLSLLAYSKNDLDHDTW
jgi:hypothetical protein